MKNISKILASVGVPLFIAGVAITVIPGSVAPALTLAFPVGVFLLGIAGITHLLRTEFLSFDQDQLTHGGSPGDNRQHIIRYDVVPPEVTHHETDPAHAH